MVNANWPAVITSVAFVGDPNDTAATPTWTDLSDRNVAWSCQRGRQYELDQTQAGEASIVFRDRDEALNPTNTASTYYPNVLPYRRVAITSMWPPTTPTGNLINIGGGQGLQYRGGMDPTFESYTVGSTPWQRDGLNWSGGVPTVTTTNPFQGAQCLTMTVSTAAGQGLGVQAPCIIGRTYTASMYVRQTVTNTLQMFVVSGYQNFNFTGAVTGTTTSTANAYVRLTVTWTATNTFHAIWVRTTGSPGAATLNVDAPQVEEGNSATTFTASGNVVYPVYGGYIERWPSTWKYSGMYGYAQTTCVDALGVLAAQPVNSEVTNNILSKHPAYYWPLWEQTNAVAFAEASGNVGPPLTSLASTRGPGVAPAAGQSSDILGDASGTAVEFTADTTTNLNQQFTALQCGGSSTTPGVKIPTTPGVAWGATVAAWVKTDRVAGGGWEMGICYIFGQTTGKSVIPIAVGFVDPGLVFAEYANATGASPLILSFDSTNAINDGLWHHVAVTIAQDSSNTTMTMYVDGSSAPTMTSTVTTASLGGFLPFSANVVTVGGESVSFMNDSLQGSLSHVAVWQSTLNSAQVADMYFAGQNGITGEHSGTRIARYIGYGYSGPASIETGTTLMGPGTVTHNTSTLDACQDVSLTEDGLFSANGAGLVLFASRTTRYLNVTARAVIGENTAGGELPYLDDVSYDYDPQLVHNQVTVTQTNGIVSAVQDATSMKRYFPRLLERTITPQSSYEAIDASNYMLARYKNPGQRISGLTFDPATNPSLWPFVLSTQIGDRVTVKRRTLSGYTMSADYFVEQIGHDTGPNQWRTTLQLSPAPAGFQPWILGDTTYSVLDTTTIPGY